MASVLKMLGHGVWVPAFAGTTELWLTESAR
jgi:hypothetical protein